MDKQKQAARNQKEDVVLNRTLVWFGGAVIVELYMLLLNRYYANYTVDKIDIMAAIHGALPILTAVFAVLAVAAALWLRSRLKQGKGGLLIGLCVGVSAGLCVGSGLARLFHSYGMVQLMCTLVPAIAVLALIYYLYQREFFTVTVLSALGILGLWLVRKAQGGHAVVVYGYMAVVAVILVAAVLTMRRLQKNDGLLLLGEKKLRILGHGVNCALFYASCAIVAVVLALGVVLGTSAAYYLMFALVGWLFVLAVYYTVKLL